MPEQTINPKAQKHIPRRRLTKGAAKKEITFCTST